MEAAQFRRPEQPPPAPPTRPGGAPGQPPNPGPPAPGGWSQPHFGAAPPYPGGPPPTGGYSAYPTHDVAGQQPVSPYAQPPTSDAPASRRRWLLLGGAAAVLLLVVALVVVAFTGGGDDSSTATAPSTPKMTQAGPQTPSGVSSRPPSPTAAPAPPPTAAPPPPPPPPVIAPADLPGLLLPAEQISQLMKAPAMTVTATDSKMIAGSITPPNCAGAWGPVHAAAYDGSGFTGVTGQSVGDSPAARVVQGVVSFPDPAAAQAYYDRQVTEWNGCKFAKVTADYGPGNSNHATLGVPTTTGGILSMPVVADNPSVPGTQCERALNVRGNVIVDVRACSVNVSGAGWNIARDIANKVAPAP